MAHRGSTPKTMKALVAYAKDDYRFEPEYPAPVCGPDDIIIKTEACGICAGDLKCNHGAAMFWGDDVQPAWVKPPFIPGHEFFGRVVEIGENVEEYELGDRIIADQIVPCGKCRFCKDGHYWMCQPHDMLGFQSYNNGGMAEYILCDEKDLVALPDELSYADGAQVACGFGTVYEAIEKVGVSGDDAVLVVGLGPVGLACLMLCKALGANKLIGIEGKAERIELAKKLGLVDHVFTPSEKNVEEVLSVTGGKGVERAFDCSANDKGRATAIRATREWGKIAFVGEGGTVNFNPSPDIIHGQKIIYGSWVTSIWKMEDLVERLVRWGIHPDTLITDRFALKDADKAYALMASGACGKVAVCFDEELK